MSLGIFNSGSFQCKAKHKKFTILVHWKMRKNYRRLPNFTRKWVFINQNTSLKLAVQTRYPERLLVWSDHVQARLLKVQSSRIFLDLFLSDLYALRTPLSVWTKTRGKMKKKSDENVKNRYSFHSKPKINDGIAFVDSDCMERTPDSPI